MRKSLRLEDDKAAAEKATGQQQAIVRAQIDAKRAEQAGYQEKFWTTTPPAAPA